MLPDLNRERAVLSHGIVRPQRSSALMRMVKKITYTLSTMSGGHSHTSVNATSPATGATTTVQTTGSSQSMNSLSNPPQQQKVSPSNQPHNSASTSGTASPRRWILFGVQGSRGPLEIEHIGINDSVNDGNFYGSIREHYRKHHPKWKQLFSMWRLGFCVAVKVKIHTLTKSFLRY
jgi:hypothetical protein